MKATTRIATALYGVVAVPGSLLLCFGCVIYVDVSRGIEPRRIDTAAGWSAQLAEASLAYSDIILVLVVVLLLSVLTVAVGFRSRNEGLKLIGAICGAMFALTLIIVGVDGRGGLVHLAERSREAAVLGTIPYVPVTPEPTPTEPPLVADDARERVREMVALSLDADDSLRDSGGRAVVADAVELVATTCDESGARTSATLELRAMDNAAALRRILAAWDRAGFAPDRAMQEDIRYSQSDAVERMSIRDKTSIDGLIHLTITSRCAVP